ncbi:MULTISPECIES: hypothetical protein [unclassified Luteibacter]|uniref:hypothetical protein n=1 Tax=Luteibacter sp. PvP019 TaxID=3156436 RepID=UPI003396F1E2
MNIEPKVSIESIVQWAEDQGVDCIDDTRSIPEIACELCKMLDAKLSLEQRKALDAARHYLLYGDVNEADAWTSELAQRVGRPNPVDMPEDIIAIERLLWAALNRVTSLSAFALEFILCVAETAGLSVDEMAPVVLRILSSTRGRDSSGVS